EPSAAPSSRDKSRTLRRPASPAIPRAQSSPVHHVVRRSLAIRANGQPICPHLAPLLNEQILRLEEAPDGGRLPFANVLEDRNQDAGRDRGAEDRPARLPVGPSSFVTAWLLWLRSPRSRASR